MTNNGAGDLEDSPSSGFTLKLKQPRTLQGQLLFSHLRLALMTGIALAVASLTINLLYAPIEKTERVHIPVAQAAMTIQVGLHRASAALNGWVALKDDQFKVARHRARQTEILPAQHVLKKSLGESNADDLAALENLDTQLDRLIKLQNWVESVAIKPGNEPARLVLMQELLPLSLHIESLMSLELSTLDPTPSSLIGTQRSTLTDIRLAILRADGALSRFVVDVSPQDEASYRRQLKQVFSLWQSYVKEEYPQYEELQTALNTYGNLGESIIAARKATRSSVAWNTIETKVKPLEDEVAFYLEGIAQRESLRVNTYVTQILHWTQRVNGASVIAFILVTLLALYLSLSGARRLSSPIRKLSQAAERLSEGKLRDALVEEGVIEVRHLIASFNQMHRSIFEREVKLQQSVQQLAHQASHDALTGLANRRTLATQLEQANSSLEAGGAGYCVCIMDLDRFKVVNDTSGHAAGDALLVELSQLLRSIVHKSDTLVRLGGDEFAIVLHNCTAADAIKVCERIRQQVEDFVFLWDGKSHRVAASIGVFEVSSRVNDASEVLQQADAACFSAKEKGRNQVQLVKSSSKAVDQKREDLHWVQRINAAIDNDELVLCVQPIVSLNKIEPTAVERFEILVRMRNMTSGELIPPGSFLPAAERYGIITRVDQWVITHLVQASLEFPEIANKQQVYWINLSASSLNDEHFVEFLEATVAGCGLPEGTINFEITETALVRNISETSKVMHRLKKLGCRFALDDFGAGITSFSLLKSLPVDYLKIDGNFVRNVQNDDVDRMFVKSIIDIGHAMGIASVAEFVENEEILAQVTKLGADYGQGYHLGKPRELIDSASNLESRKPIDIAS